MPIRPEKPRGVMFVTLEQLETFMNKRKIDTANWIINSPQQLLTAIHRGEVEVYDDMEHGPVRQISAVHMDVAFTDKQAKYFLFSERTGDRGLVQTLNASEIYMNQRVKNNALARVLKDILGIDKFQIPIYQGTEVLVDNDSLYPGLKTKNVFFHYEMGIDASQFKPQYHSGLDQGQTFVWRPGETQYR